MPSKKTTAPLLPDRYYHIYNRGNNREKLFLHEDDYWLFLEKFTQYMSDYCQCFAYCLLPNHFHFLIKVNDSDDEDYGKLVSEKFRCFFQTYAASFNKLYNRRGSLFTKNFKRIQVGTMEYLKYLVYYIHSNPQKHEYFDSFVDYEYSSYRSILNGGSTFILKDDLLEWFNNDREEYVEFHQVLLDERKVKGYILED